LNANEPDLINELVLAINGAEIEELDQLETQFEALTAKGTGPEPLALKHRMLSRCILPNYLSPTPSVELIFNIRR
jgi:hypothetical protein